jgi:predicted nucleic acid-binding protein
MSFLLDICVVSELAKPAGDQRVKLWASSVKEFDFYISALTLGELQKGAARLANSKKKTRLLTWLHEDLVQRFTGRVLAVDEAVAVRWGNMQAQLEKQGKPIPAIDGLIAATALQHRLTVVTRNTRDMDPSGVALFNPWTD